MKKITKKILYLEAGSVFGGSFISLLELLNGISRDKYQPIVIFYIDNPALEKLRRKGVKCYLLKISPFQRILRICLGKFIGAGNRLPPNRLIDYGTFILRILQCVPQILNLIKIIQRERIDTVHLNNQVIYNLDGVIACYLTKTKCISHLRSLRKVRRVEAKIANRVVGKFIAISAAVKDNYLTQGISTEKIVIIHNAKVIPPRLLLENENEVRKRYGISHTHKVVGIVGRLIAVKGHKYFLEAASEVSKQMPESKFMVVGDGELFSELKTLSRLLSISDDVVFTGFCEDVLSIINIFDVLVFASDAEGFGRVLLEAMLLSKPVVSTNAGGAKEVVVDGITGFFVPPRNSKALAEKILFLLQDDTLRKRMGNAGRNRLEEKFNMETHIEKVEKNYSSL